MDNNCITDWPFIHFSLLIFLAPGYHVLLRVILVIHTMQRAKSNGDSLKVMKLVDLGLLNLIMSKSSLCYLT